MNIKTKKQNEDGIVRLETSGSIREVIVKEDFFKPEKAMIAVCFKGKSSSGIVEFSYEEIENLYAESRKAGLGSMRVMKFNKK